MSRNNRTTPRSVSFRAASQAMMDGGMIKEDESSIGDDSVNSGTSGLQSLPTTGNTTTNRDDAAETLYFAKKETRRVRGLRAMVFSLLLLVAVAVSLAVYFVTDASQQTEFEATFEGSATKVISSFEDILRQKIAAVASFGVATTIYAKDRNQTFPFVTLNDFQRRAASTRALSGSLYLQILPIVSDMYKGAWGGYSLGNKGWLDEGRQYQQEQGVIPELNGYTEGVESQIFPAIFDATLEGVAPDPGPGPYFPAWQQSPILPFDAVNYNYGRLPPYGPYIKEAAESGKISLGALVTAPPGLFPSRDFATNFFSYYMSFAANEPTNYTGEPISTVFVPVMDSFADDRTPGAILVAVIRWSAYFRDILIPTARSVRAVIENPCDGAFTYEIQGGNVEYIGQGNRADQKYKDMVEKVDLDYSQFLFEPDTVALGLKENNCQYSLRVYPTADGEEEHNDNFPLMISLTVAAVFVFTAFVFFIYDTTVERRQQRVLDTAKRSTAIVSSIFPKKVRDQMMGVQVQGNATKLRALANNGDARKGGEDESVAQSTVVGSGGPIADLFPECTVMFADVAGFTSWSSIREPSQVFTLLETIYAAMDRVANKRRVFKVETIGDCYLAVCGLPDTNKDHAIVMARFARDCISEFVHAVKRLELSLGPETSDLMLRVGLNSGPITAGVLRGERSRFQLFGDTVNTGARMESSGEGNRIHISEVTAKLIEQAGHGAWITARDEMVQLKGKGMMKTFWLNPGKKDIASTNRQMLAPPSPMKSPGGRETTKARIQRLVPWNADLLIRLIRQIVAHRVEKKEGNVPVWTPKGAAPLEEVVEVVELPEKDTRIRPHMDPTNVEISDHIIELVHDYVSEIMDMYQDNPFHNFEHASHVTMSVAKLMSRIVAPSNMDFTDDQQATSTLHDHTYGITSDPLTQFACVLSALIHDADHPGVSNTTLAEEDNELVQRYGGKSLAEQNSVDKAWSLLMLPRFQPMLSLICTDHKELARLRQLVVNSVMATDIMDPDLKKLRNNRWEKAFASSSASTTSSHQEESAQIAINRKATIVIEHLIQASDVSHTMQHWNVYVKWNGRLFKEMYKAYLDGRKGAKDPSTFWAKGEIGFFDFYIIPLAKKLKECGVFGVSSDEYLQYAMNNRDEWKRKGEAVVEQLIAEVHHQYGRKREEA